MPTDRQIMNARANELNDDPQPYYDEMKEKWLEMIALAAENYFDNNVSEDDHRPDVTEFIEYLEEEHDEEFEFQDFSDWFASEVSSAADDYGDMKYEEMRDSKYD